MIFISIVHSINFFHTQCNIYIDSAIVLCCSFSIVFFVLHEMLRMKPVETNLKSFEWKQRDPERFFNIVFCIEQTHLDTVIAFFVYYRHVAPSHPTYNIDHCFHLVMIGGYSTWKVFEALFIAELRTCWKEWNLWKKNGWKKIHN